MPLRGADTYIQQRPGQNARDFLGAYEGMSSLMERKQRLNMAQEQHNLEQKQAVEDAVLAPLKKAKMEADLANSLQEYHSALQMQESEKLMTPLVGQASQEFNQLMMETDPDKKANAALAFAGRYAQFSNTKKWGEQFKAYNKIANDLYSENSAIRKLQEAERIRATGPESPIGKMVADYDRARAAGDPAAAEFILAGIKESVTPKGMKLEVGPDGGIMFSQGSTGDGGMTTANTTKSQERQYQQERLIREGGQLLGILRPQDLGIQGNVGEVAGGFLGQLDPKLANAQVAQNRTRLRTFRESALRAVSDDSRFSNNDRTAIEQMLPSDGWVENLPQAQGKLKAVLTIFAQRATNEAQRQGGQSWTDLPPEEIIVQARAGKIDKAAAGAILEALHPAWVEEQKRLRLAQSGVVESETVTETVVEPAP